MREGERGRERGRERENFRDEREHYRYVDLAPIMSVRTLLIPCPSWIFILRFTHKLLCLFVN